MLIHFHSYVNQLTSSLRAQGIKKKKKEKKITLDYTEYARDLISRCVPLKFKSQVSSSFIMIWYNIDSLDNDTICWYHKDCCNIILIDSIQGPWVDVKQFYIAI